MVNSLISAISTPTEIEILSLSRSPLGEKALGKKNLGFVFTLI